MFRKYTSDQNIVMCWRMLNSRAYRMAGASDCCCRHTHLPFARELLIRSRDFFVPGSASGKRKMIKNRITNKKEN